VLLFHFIADCIHPLSIEMNALRRLDIVALVPIVGGGIGMGVHGYFLHIAGPVWVFPNFLGLWLSLFSAFFGLQMLYLQRKHYDSIHEFRADTMYYAFLVCVAVVLAIGYFVGYRLDGGLWSLFLAVTLGIDLLIVRRSTHPSVHQLLIQDVDTDAPSASCIDRSELFRGAFVVFNVVLRGLAFFLLCFLLGGCWSQAIGYRMYPPRGTFVTLSYPGGQMQSVHVWCTGPRNASLPTFWFDVGGGGHSMSDLYGLQFALNDAGRRVCVHDVPGTAWSEYAVPQQRSVTGRVIEATGEPGPFILVGAMDNAQDRIYEYAHLSVLRSVS
jgi:hypothetical protein